MMASLKWSRAPKPPEPICLGRQVVGDRRIGVTPASQVEEALALHRQLEPAFVPHGCSGKDLISPRRRVQSDLVERIWSQQRIPTTHGIIEQGHGDAIIPHTSGRPRSGVLRLRRRIRGPRPTPLSGLPGP